MLRIFPLLLMLFFSTEWTTAQLSMGNKLALVIGVADYADEKIPDLKYSDNDADAYVAYLKSAAGGNYSDEQIMLLTNEEATFPQVYGALDWLLETAQANDKITIYFSGHGDVESKIARQKGFLLTHDTPASNYRIGALRIEDINDYVETLVQNNQAKVMVITDACRSGSLAGGTVGVQATAKALSTEFENTIKIMSCQANELSQEGNWGGGRGVFSYHLLDGMTGMADGNEDKKVSLLELRRYLEDKVSTDTDGSQIPVVQGSLGKNVSFVNEAALQALIAERAIENQDLAAVASKADAVLIVQKSDTTVQRLYQEFQKAIAEQYFLPSEINVNRASGKSADELYQILIKEPSLKPLHGVMKRNYVVALQEEAQTSLNGYLKADPRVLAERWNTYGASYQSTPPLLNRAAEILGEKHPLYGQIKAKQYYFEGLLLRLEGEKTEKKSLFEQALAKEELALELDGDAAYIYNEIGLIYGGLEKLELEETAYKKARELAPTWVMPLNNLSSTALDRGAYEEALRLANEALGLDSESAVVYFNLGNANFLLEELDMADSLYRIGIKVDSTYHKFYNSLGYLYYVQKDFSSAIKMYNKAIAVHPTYVQAYMNLGILYHVEKNYKRAEENYLEILKINPENKWGNYNIACLKALQNQESAALEWLEKSLQFGFNDFEYLKDDKELEALKELKEFKNLINKYEK